MFPYFVLQFLAIFSSFTHMPFSAFLKKFRIPWITYMVASFRISNLTKPDVRETFQIEISEARLVENADGLKGRVKKTASRGF